MDVKECTKCSELVDERCCIVNGRGNTNAEILFIGEAPGEEEDKLGKPFVGKSGKTLMEHIREAGIPDDKYRITNSIRCRPPDNRNPTSEELSNCYEYLMEEIEEVSPTVIVCLGKIASQNLLGREVYPTSEGGSVYSTRVNERSYNVVVSVHPASILYDKSNEEILGKAIKKSVEICDNSNNQESLYDFED